MVPLRSTPADPARVVVSRQRWTPDELALLDGPASDVEVAELVGRGGRSRRARRRRASQRPAECGEFDQRPRDTAADRGNPVGHELAAVVAVFVAVGGDHPLVDPPGRLDLDMLLGPEQRAESSGLLVGQQLGAGVQGPPRGIQRVALHPAVAVDGLLHPAPAPVERVPGEADDVERIMQMSA